MNKIFIYPRPWVNKDFFMCFSSLFLSTKYQKIDDLFICNEFSSIFCERTNSTLNESRGLSRVNVGEENCSEWLKNCYYFSFIYLFFNSTCVRLCLVFNPLSTVLSRLEVFSVQIGCVFDKLGVLQSGILWYPSVKQQVFKSRKKYLFQKTTLLQRRFSNLAMKMLAKATTIFVSMAVPWVCR